MSPSPSAALKPIHPVDLAAERAQLGPALEEAVLRVLHSGQYVLGPEVAAFEQEFADFHASSHGSCHSIAVASGTDALVLGLKGLDVGPGDGVVTSPFTFFASAGCVAWVGGKPQLADVDPETALLTPESARSAIDGSTKMLLPVHLYGQMVDMKGYRALADEKGLALFEDGAQCHGAEREGIAPGELGDACAFSFYPTKNLGAAGEGGLLLARDEAIATRIRRLRDHGSPEKYSHAEVGTNSRLQGFQGAVLRIKLAHLAAWNEARRAHAAHYDELFSDIEEVRPLRLEPASRHAYHQYTVRIRGPVARDRVAEVLRGQGIGAAVHYPTPVHFQEAAKPWGYAPGDFPVAEALCREVLCLPVHPFLEGSDVERVAAAVTEAARTPA